MIWGSYTDTNTNTQPNNIKRDRNALVGYDSLKRYTCDRRPATATSHGRYDYTPIRSGRTPLEISDKNVNTRNGRLPTDGINSPGFQTFF